MLVISYLHIPRRLLAPIQLTLPASPGKSPAMCLEVHFSESGSGVFQIFGLRSGSSNSIKDKVKLLFGPAKQTAEGTHDPTHQNDNHQHKCQGNDRRPIRMACGKPCKEHSERIFSQAQ